MVYFMENPKIKWMITGSIPILGNSHIYLGKKNNDLTATSLEWCLVSGTIPMPYFRLVKYYNLHICICICIIIIYICAYYDGDMIVYIYIYTRNVGIWYDMVYTHTIVVFSDSAFPMFQLDISAGHETPTIIRRHWGPFYPKSLIQSISSYIPTYPRIS